MFCIKTFFCSVVILLTFSSNTSSQGNYFPPPSDINYANGTLTIYPPDSLPGEAVVLLGYNIQVESVFYDNVMVDNQTDTIIYAFNYNTLYPGNHEFCVTTVYNFWISDPVCDSALVIYGYDLPFLEDWSSGNFTENQWYTESGNWTMETDEGNPGPAAVFSGIPAQFNYEIPLESFAIRADSIQSYVGQIWLSFDVKLESNGTTGNEKLITQYWDWETNSWHSLWEFSNRDGSFDWQNNFTNFTIVRKKIFKLRFVAKGANSSEISSWSVDNIYIYRKCPPASDLELNEHPDFNELTWVPPEFCVPDTYLHWDDGQNAGNSIGTGNAAEFSVAAKWEPPQLDIYDGAIIRKVRFFPAEPNASYNIRIWVGDSVVSLILDQPVSDPQIGEWNEIDLDSIVYIVATKDLYIGYNVIAQTGYPAGVDDGPALDGYGNMMYWENTWQSLLEINPYLDYNWNIGFLAGPDYGDPSMRCLIYRNNNDQGYVYYDFVDDDRVYEDHNIDVDDIYCYKVTIEMNNLGDTCESPPSNEVCSSILGTADDTKNKTLVAYPNPGSDIIHIKSEEKIDHIRLYSIPGDLVIEKKIPDDHYILDVSDIKSGIYFLEVETGNGCIKEKISIIK